MFKKTILFSCLLAMVWGFATSNLYAQRGFEIGGQVIPQSVWIFNQDDFDAGDELDYEKTWGLAYGFNAGINFSDNIGVQSGFLVSKQGQKYKHQGLAYDNSEIKLEYFKVPILLKLNTDPTLGASFLLNAGVQFGFLRDAEYYLDDVKLIPSGFEIKDAFEKVDLAAVAGVGVLLRFTDNIHFNVLVRADYSIRDMEDKEFKAGFITYPDGRESAHNLTGGIQAGINFVFGN